MRLWEEEVVLLLCTDVPMYDDTMFHTLLKADKRKRVTLPKDARHRKYRAHVMNNGTVVLVPVISPNNSAPPSGPEPKAARSWLV